MRSSALPLFIVLNNMTVVSESHLRFCHVFHELKAEKTCFWSVACAESFLSGRGGYLKKIENFVDLF